MTNLLIAHPQNLHVVDLSYPTESNDNYYYYNLLGGPRAAQFKTASASSSTFTYEFDAATTLNTLFIGSASEIINSDWSSSASGFWIEVQRSSDGASWSGSVSSLISDFIGTMETDYIYQFTEETYKYWRVILTPNANSEFKISKLFLCEAVDFGREPYKVIQGAIESDRLTSIAGYDIENNYYRNALSVDLAWKGLTDAELESFLDILDVDGRQYITLFNPSENLQLGGMQCIYGIASNIRHSKAKAKNDYNYLSFTFNEQF